MIEVLTATIVIAVIASLAFLARGSDKESLHREFEERLFEIPGGQLRGAELQVVKYVFQESGNNDTGRGMRTGWWYCVLPGPRWLLVIGQDTTVTMTRTEVTWVVRELSEERMRGALAADPKAMALAFDDAVDGRTAG